MTYTAQQRRLIVDALRKSKMYLWDGVYMRDIGWGERPRTMPAICQTLMAAEADRQISRQTKEMVCEIIGDRLKVGERYRLWFSDWLIAMGVPPEEVVDTKRMQAHRLAWMDKLIEEFSDA